MISTAIVSLNTPHLHLILHLPLAATSLDESHACHDPQCDAEQAATTTKEMPGAGMYRRAGDTVKEARKMVEAKKSKQASDSDAQGLEREGENVPMTKLVAEQMPTLKPVADEPTAKELPPSEELPPSVELAADEATANKNGHGTKTWLGCAIAYAMFLICVLAQAICFPADRLVTCS